MSNWITTAEVPHASHYYYFRKCFDATAKSRLSARVCADTRYQLYLNGKMIGEGPCQGPQYVRYYETYDLSRDLNDGENEILIKVLHIADDHFIASFHRERPALWFDGILQNGETCTPLSTDESWCCEREDAIRLIPRGFLSLPPFDEVLGASVRTPVAIHNFYEPIPDCGYNPYGLNDPYILKARLIPQMQTASPKAMRVVRRGKGFLELDAGIYTTAKVALRLCAKKGSVIRINYAECYAVCDPETGRPHTKAIRDDAACLPDASARSQHFDLLHTTGKEQTFETFWYRAFRFIRLEFEEDAELSCISAEFSSYFYPLDEDGSFCCSDERLNQMWCISRNTLLCCMHEIYVDCPHYEQQQYEMDSALEMLFTLRMASDMRMPHKSLIDLAHSQMPDGMLQANYPSTHVQIIPDFTLFWVLMLRDYLRYTGDLSTVQSLTGVLDKALEAFENLKNADGLISPTPYWHFVDWVPAWERGVPTGGDEEPLTVTCLMYAAALRAGAEICTALNRPMRADEYRARADEMINAVKLHCYDADAKLYRNVPSRREFSQHTTLWAILSGAVVGTEAESLIDRTFDGHVRVEKCTFSMNHYLFRALELADRYRYAPELFAGWQRMLDLHCTTWCENPDSPRSECHAWSSAPAYEFSAMVLGVYPTADGYKTVRIRPDFQTHALTWAKGSVPTPKGNILVEWKKSDGEIELSVALPNTDMQAEILLPNGTSLSQTQLNAQYTCKL
ncbi:MAG: hypothetical protein IJW50_05065 [Clostridia bacterium]|nr:hypothetical protein [Clostridia bacterium]